VLSAADVAVVWAAFQRGETFAAMGAALGCTPETAWNAVARHGGLPPRPRQRAARALTRAEREEISRGLAASEPQRAMARRLRRAPSTISREIKRHGGPAAYRAHEADQAAWDWARRPKRCRLATQGRLRRVVRTKLQADWAPAQIAGWLVTQYPTDLTMRVSAETIYRTLYVQARGALKRELTAHLRQRHVIRKPRAATRRPSAAGRLVGMVSISDRPPAAEDRAVPGHWEGDLLVGGGRSQVATLVERRSRYVLLVRLARRDATSVAHALARRMRRLPTSLKQSLTWDQGKEMAHHVAFRVATDVHVYFCDPHSPWQRGSNENTNGLLRQYFPKGRDLSKLTQRQLDAVARKLNTRPRQTLGWQTPAHVLGASVASTD
jgi:IS30 family transposase